ncbi:hypothetical protein BC828DRAFT_404695 [Blastocladiella britannica]|nr:hypothetical protein BC828DRAFT_404695 [Blastocladiella britannica]
MALKRHQRGTVTSPVPRRVTRSSTNQSSNTVVSHEHTNGAPASASASNSSSAEAGGDAARRPSPPEPTAAQLLGIATTTTTLPLPPPIPPLIPAPVLSALPVLPPPLHPPSSASASSSTTAYSSALVPPPLSMPQFNAFPFSGGSLFPPLPPASITAALAAAAAAFATSTPASIPSLTASDANGTCPPPPPRTIAPDATAPLSLDALSIPGCTTAMMMPPYGGTAVGAPPPILSPLLLSYLQRASSLIPYASPYISATAAFSAAFPAGDPFPGLGHLSTNVNGGGPGSAGRDSMLVGGRTLEAAVALLAEIEARVDVVVLASAGAASEDDYLVQRGPFRESVMGICDIVTEKLYRAKGRSLEDYFKEQFSISRAQVYRILDTATVIRDLEATTDLPAPFTRGLPPIPIKQRVCATIKQVASTPADRQLLWRRVLAKNTPTLVTSKDIKDTWDLIVSERNAASGSVAPFSSSTTTSRRGGRKSTAAAAAASSSSRRPGAVVSPPPPPGAPPTPARSVTSAQPQQEGDVTSPPPPLPGHEPTDSGHDAVSFSPVVAALASPVSDDLECTADIASASSIQDLLALPRAIRGPGPTKRSRNADLEALSISPTLGSPSPKRVRVDANLAMVPIAVSKVGAAVALPVQAPSSSLSQPADAPVVVTQFRSVADACGMAYLTTILPPPPSRPLSLPAMLRKEPPVSIAHVVVPIESLPPPPPPPPPSLQPPVPATTATTTTAGPVVVFTERQQQLIQSTMSGMQELMNAGIYLEPQIQGHWIAHVNRWRFYKDGMETPDDGPGIPASQIPAGFATSPAIPAAAAAASAGPTFPVPLPLPPPPMPPVAGAGPAVVRSSSGPFSRGASF